MIKTDLHTHSVASPDGGLSLADYRDALLNKKFNFIAITDHNRTDFALEARQKLGNHIIVGEEIDTSEGEVIGLYLKKTIPAGLGIKQTLSEIQSQDGLVYIPHPFETKRKGIKETMLNQYIDKVDIIEVYNGRAWGQNLSSQAKEYAKKMKKTMAASSDAHGNIGWGRTYTSLRENPTKTNILKLLTHASLIYDKPHPLSILYPSYNRIRSKK